MPICTDVQELERASEEAFEQAEKILKQYTDEDEIPDTQAELIDSYLADAEKNRADADRIRRLNTLKSHHDDPSSKRVVGTGNAKVGHNYEEDRPFNNFGDQLIAIAKAAQDPTKTDQRLYRVKAPTGLGETQPADGGFLVQTDFSSEILSRMHDTGLLAEKCRTIPISSNSNSVKIPAIDETSRADGSRLGGVRGYWADEAASLTASQPKFRQVQLTLNKLTCLIYSTDELMADAAALGSVVSNGASEELGFKLDDAIFNGDGAGKPLGAFNAANPSIVTVSKETGQDATTIVAENIEKMYSRMWAKSAKKAIWYINQDCWPQLFQLSHAVGTGGIPVFIRPNNGIVDAPFGQLLGRPVMPIEHCATLGTVNDIVFADYGEYALARKGAMESASSIHVQFLTDQMVFRFILRIDGQPIWNSALTPFKGSNTHSPFIRLATRS